MDMVKGINMRHSTPIEEFIDLQDRHDLIEPVFLQQETILELGELKNLLKPSYAKILTLYYYDEFSLQEISVLLNITCNNVGVRLNRVIKALLKLY